MNDVTADRDAKRLAWARAYPYEAPAQAYIYHKDGIRPFDPSATAGRTPVLAIGSNRAPDRLAQKFGHDGSHEIPVQKARVKHFDIVYATHITAYGAAPAMLQVSPGTEIDIWLNWLTDTQLVIMHETEIVAANYSYALLPNMQVRLDDGRRLTEIAAYVGQRGHFTHNKSPLAMAAVPATHRRYPTADTAAVLAHMRSKANVDETVDEFILRCIDDKTYRDAVVETLSKDAVRFSYPYRIVAE